MACDVFLVHVTSLTQPDDMFSMTCALTRVFPAAHICDSETGAWFRFNDEEVEKIKSLKLNAEDDLEGG